MAEKQEAKVTRAKSRPFEKKKSNVSVTSEERVDESVETGYSSAQQSSDILSGAEATSESAVWTSEDHGATNVESHDPTPVTKKQQKKPKSQKKEVESSERDLKLDERDASVISCKTTLKKSAETKQAADNTVESSQKSPLSGCQPQPGLSVEDGTKQPKDEGASSQKKRKSPKKSMLQKLRSHSKSAKSEAAADSPQCSEEPTKEDETKYVYLGPDIRTPAVKGRRFRVIKIKPVRIRSKAHQTSKAGPKSKEEEEGSKKESKAPLKTKSSKKQEGSEISTPEAEATQKPSMLQSLASTCERVSSGIQSIQLSKPKKDKVLLLSHDESMDSASSDGNLGKEAVGAGKGTESREIGVNTSSSNNPWVPLHSQQEGGFQKDVVWATFSSSAEDTGTDMSVVSDSSAIQGGSESKKGASSSTDSLSEIPGLKEEAPDGQKGAKKSQLHGKKRVKNKESSDSDEESKAFAAVCGSPVKKLAPQRKSTDNSSGE